MHATAENRPTITGLPPNATRAASTMKTRAPAPRSPSGTPIFNPRTHPAYPGPAYPLVPPGFGKRFTARTRNPKGPFEVEVNREKGTSSARRPRAVNLYR